MGRYDASHEFLSDEQKTELIKQVVTLEGERLRQAYPVLRHQDAIGASILLFSLSGMLASALLYAHGMMSARLCIPVIAVFASFTHELEHDLIHWMYFRRKPWAHHLMMALVWLARPTTINPWLRRGLHFNHHKYSGQSNDIEERAVTNGETWGLLRLFMTGDNMLAILLRLHRAPTWKLRRKMLMRGLAGYVPLGLLSWGLWYAFLALHTANGLASLFAADIGWSDATLARIQLVDLLVVTWVAPNVLRTFCLHFVTSNMHYFGDVEDGNVLQQTQVLNPWWLIPLQLFCFNFGSTHAIHHFVVREPFYFRQMTAPVAHRVMREMGVRFNDLGTFRRANRFGPLALALR